MSIRSLVEQFRNEVYSKTLTPDRAADILRSLSALIGNCLDEIKETEMKYNKRLQEAYKIEAKANRAKLIANTSPEYSNYLEAKATNKIVEAMMSSLKYFLKQAEREWKDSRFQ